MAFRFLVIVGVIVSVFGVITGPGVLSGAILLGFLGMGIWAVQRYRRDLRLSRGHVFKALFDDLERINDAHPDGTTFVGDDGRDLFVNRRYPRGGFIRVVPDDTERTGFTGDDGTVVLEGFWFGHLRGVVLHHTTLRRVGRGPDGERLLNDAFVGEVTDRTLKQVFRLVVSTGAGLASEDDLRSLVAALRRADTRRP